MFSSIRFLCVCILVLMGNSTLAAEDYFQVTELAPDLLLVTTDQGSYSNNSLAFTGGDGLLLVDTHHEADRDSFVEFVQGLGFGDPKIIICTHRHVEHLGSNDAFGADPILIAHDLFPKKLRSGTFLFTEYPPLAFPDITFADSLQIHFNGETIRLANIGGSHDDNEIMVHFREHKIAHTSSVVNGFNFPSVDSDGDVLGFEKLTRRLMTLLPQDVRIVSGHHGKAKGYETLGTWDQLADYADMMKHAIEIVQRGLDEGKTTEEMQEAKVLAEYEDYGGSYVSATDWVGYLTEALTETPAEGDDVCLPVYQVWKKSGAEEAVKHYQELKENEADRYAVNEYILMGIGSKLYSRKLYADASVFLEGSVEMYPESEYAYYTHYLAAKAFEKDGDKGKALGHCRESVHLNSEFAGASAFLKELEED